MNTPHGRFAYQLAYLRYQAAKRIDRGETNANITWTAFHIVEEKFMEIVFPSLTEAEKADVNSAMNLAASQA